MSKLLKREVRRFEVKSLSNGCMLIVPFYRAKPINSHAIPVGVITRMAIAAEIQRLLNKALK